MANEYIFQDLISAVHNAVIEAQKITENQHMNMLKDFFDENNNPICITLNLPSYQNENGKLNVVHSTYEIPKLCFVPVSSLKVKELKVNFKVLLKGLVKDNDSTDNDSKVKQLIKLISTTDSANREENNFANVEIVFEGTNPPEGLMKVYDQVIKKLP